MIKGLKKVWYKSECGMLYGVKVVSNVTFGTARFCVKHTGTLLTIAAVAGLTALTVMVLGNNRQNVRNKNRQSREHDELIRQNERLACQNSILFYENMRLRERRSNNCRANGYRNRHREESIFSRIKQNIINWLDRKKNALNEWADNKIQKCNDACDRLYATNNGISGCGENRYEVSRGDEDATFSGKDDLPTYEDVMRQKEQELSLSSTPTSVDNTEIVPSAPSEGVVFDNVNEANNKSVERLENISKGKESWSACL